VAYSIFFIYIIISGHCTLDGRTIRVNQSVSLQDPCEEWTCDYVSKSVVIAGCSPTEAGPDCKMVDGKGDYPDCCPQMLCY
ncbi:hypothetical protein MTO96_038242, partial [Rhipicephalus appendiculatus]